MIQIRRAEERGHANHGWLDTNHTFSFADYYDPRFMGFRSLRVINDDTVAAGRGFGTHGHRDMEIISYVLEGALEHRDTIGTGSVIRPGDVQRMSAGTGVRHSEFNGSQTERVHFLQIWIEPEKEGIAPGYEEKRFSDEEKRNQLRLIASRDGRGWSLTIHQDVSVYATVLETGHEVTHTIEEGRHAWVHVARGSALVNGLLLKAGDGAAVSRERSISLVGEQEAEILLFDLA
jgi:redox-sensitive bicupin YhaK (pirin superfamily)